MSHAFALSAPGHPGRLGAPNLGLPPARTGENPGTLHMERCLIHNNQCRCVWRLYVAHRAHHAIGPQRTRALSVPWRRRSWSCASSRWEVAFRCVGQDAQDPKMVYIKHFSVRQEALSQRGNVGLSSASGEVRADTALDWGPDGLAENST